MKDEMKRIMKMVEEGKLSSDEAAELLEALQNQDTLSTSEEAGNNSTSYLGKALKIRITSDHKERVRLNIPIRFVKWVLKTGHDVAKAIPDAKQYAEDIDMELIMKAIDNEVEGKIIDLETEDGETVEIYIE